MTVPRSKESPESAGMKDPMVSSTEIPSSELPASASAPESDAASLEVPSSLPSAEAEAAAAADTQASPATSPTLDQARLFLRDDSVRRESPERKAAFLARKGLSQAQIDELLAEEESPATPTSASADSSENVSLPSVSSPPSDSSTSSASSASSPPIPPIVTYPEFLARPPRQRLPPLITPDSFLTTVYAATGAASLLYGTARFVIAPMVEALTGARAELHETTAAQLARLNDRLASVVSTVPPAPAAAQKKKSKSKKTKSKSASDAASDSDSDADSNAPSSASESSISYDDPTEMFHRDVGVQTSPLPSPVPESVAAAQPNSADAATSQPPPPPPSAPQRQTDKLNALAAALQGLAESTSNSASLPPNSMSATAAAAAVATGLGSDDVLAEIQTALSMFREDVDRLTRPPGYMYGSAYGIYGVSSSGSDAATSTSNSAIKYGGSGGYVTTTRNEPNDEIRKAKENIRRVKGALLTSRTFPTAR